MDGGILRSGNPVQETVSQQHQVVFPAKAENQLLSVLDTGLRRHDGCEFNDKTNN